MKPSIKIARTSYGRARKELRQARDDEGVRQAAEKGWRAAREAVYTVLFEGGLTPHGTMGGGRVRDFEEKFLGGYCLDISEGYAEAKDTLHGECFYDGDYGIRDLAILRSGGK